MLVTSHWHVRVPLKLFKEELSVNRDNPTATIQFEMRIDRATGHAFFGMLQDKGALWQYAPYKEHAQKASVFPNTVVSCAAREGDSADNNSACGSSACGNSACGSRASSGTVEYSVADAEAAEDAIDIDRIDFAKLEVVFHDMVFRASYLAMFINKVSADKVTLKFAPHEFGGEGVVVKQPIVVEYSVGERTSFKFVLSPESDDDIAM